MGGRLILAAAIVGLLGAAGAAQADNPALTGNVGQNDAYSISLVDAGGAPVTHLDPGTYTLVLHDHSDIHNYHLSGPGVDVSTGIEEIGDSTATVTLGDGTYTYYCDAHPGQMRHTFTVGTVTTPPPSATKLTAAIGPGTAFSLRPTAALSAGKFAITVRDRTATDGFRLAGPHLAKATGIAFRGTVTWNVTLAAGRYSFGSVRHPKLRHSFTVSSY